MYEINLSTKSRMRSGIHSPINSGPADRKPEKIIHIRAPPYMTSALDGGAGHRKVYEVRKFV